jgi:hypothetical protein
MERVMNKDIHADYSLADGFTLSYITDDNRYYRKQYIGYSIRTAKRDFKKHLYNEWYKEAALPDTRPLTRDEVLLGALRCICAGNMGAARELMGNS